MTLTATPSSGSVFAGWTGACSVAQATCTVTVNEANNITATFAPVFTLSVKTSGKGAVNAAAAGIVGLKTVNVICVGHAPYFGNDCFT